MTCTRCGRVIGFAGPIGRWQNTPDEDELLDARLHGDQPLRRFFVCHQPYEPVNGRDKPQVAAGYCYRPSEHLAYAGTARCDWVLVARR